MHQPILVGTSLCRLKSLLSFAPSSIVVLLVFLEPAIVQALDVSQTRRVCTTLFQTQSFREASMCFQRLFKRSGKPADLLNAAVSLRKAAQSSKSVGQRAFLREQAAGLLRRYLPLAPTEARWVRAQIVRIESNIGYAQVQINSLPLGAFVTIEGYRFRLRKRLPLKLKLRPGAYTLTLTKAKHKPRTIRTTFQPRKQYTFEYSLLKASVSPRPKPPPNKNLASWLLVLGGGTVLSATGVVFLGLAINNQVIVTAPNSIARDAKAASEALTWQPYVTAGFLVVGGGLLIAGVLLKSRTSPSPRASLPSSPQHRPKAVLLFVSSPPRR